MKVSEYIAQFLLEREITQCFSVTGGFAMHLNDSFGSCLNVVHTHGENPAGYAAIGWSKITNKPSVVCVTAGCGATNAVTPCLIAYQDSTPVFFISGAVPHKDNVRFLNHVTRTYAGSDCDIIDMIKNVTKFSYELWDPAETKKILEQCVWHLTEGRPGPVWLSVPLDIQSQHVPDVMEGWTPPLKKSPPEFPIDLWNTSKRPVILIGGGIRTSETEFELEQFVQRHKIPVICSFFGTDLVPEWNIGRVGVVGNRTGNFIFHRADLVLALGCRVSKSITGYQQNTKTIIQINCENNWDLRDFFQLNLPVKNVPMWSNQAKQLCDIWFHERPNPGLKECPYNILEEFFDKKPEGQNIVVSSGSIYCVTWHTCVVKPGDRFISSGHGDMGYELPCAIGSALASGRVTWAIIGDGSFQFNVQELQTLKTLSVPVKILYFNNGGYGAIQITQDTYFKRRFGVEVPCPDVSKVCHAWDIPYFTSLNDAIAHNGFCLVELKCIVQQRYPKLYNQLNSNGIFENRPMDDMYPFKVLPSSEFNEDS